MRVSLTKSQLSTKRGAELFKILCGITQDGMLTNEEVQRLKSWLAETGLDRLPGEKALLDTIQIVLANGKISRDERKELQREIERILPPSQRKEAREARKLYEVIDDAIQIEKSEIIPPVISPDQTRSFTRSQKQQRLLEAAVRAHDHYKQKGKTSCEVRIPERQPYEGNASLKQKDYLWSLGLKDQTVLDLLGRHQASAIIDQIKLKQKNRANAIFALILSVIIVLIIIWIF